MDQEHVDCLVIPPSGTSAPYVGAASRYLTHVGGGGADVSAVFPLRREPAAIATEAGTWSSAQPWCTDLREAEPSHATAVLEKLSEVGLRHHRIGIVGLDDGNVPAGFVDRLMSENPQIKWVDFTTQLDEIRGVKSRQEIAFLGRSAQIVDAAYDAATSALHRGVSENGIWSAAVETLCRMGSELPIRTRWSSGISPGEPSACVPTRPAESGWLFLTEMEAAWGGYRVRGAQPFAFGRPDPAYVELMKLEAEVWGKALHVLRPGLRLSDLDRHVQSVASRVAQTTGVLSDVTCELVVRGGGLGGDWPRLGGAKGPDQPTGDRELVPGVSFTLKAILRSEKRWIAWSDGVVITERGARRLGSADPALRLVDA